MSTPLSELLDFDVATLATKLRDREISPVELTEAYLTRIERTDAALRASGLVHLLALSGLHVAWLAGVARALAAIAGGGVFARAMAGALAAGGYALVAGPIPSLARAVVAEGVSALACAARRAADPIQSLALAPLVLLACAPAWAGDLGFQLSCAATLGLVAIGGPWSAATRGLPRLARGAASGALPGLSRQAP